VFHTAVDHTLRGEGLVAAQSPGFKYRYTEACRLGAVCQPQAGHAAADNGQIQLKIERALGHGQSLIRVMVKDIEQDNPDKTIPRWRSISVSRVNYPCRGSGLSC